MRSRTPFLPGISPLFYGRAPMSLRDRLTAQVRRFEQTSLGGLKELFSPWISIETFNDESITPGSRRRSYWPELTFWAILCQVLDPGASCREIVRKIQCWSEQQGLPRPSSRTGAYCQARQRLPFTLLRKIWNDTAQALETSSRQSDNWKGHRLLVADGTGGGRCPIRFSIRAPTLSPVIRLKVVVSL